MESGLSSADPGFRIRIRFMGENWILVTKLGTPSFHRPEIVCSSKPFFVRTIRPLSDRGPA